MILAKRLMMCLLKAGWGEWILNPAVTVNTIGIAHYTAYKTNQREYYDSYANLDLTEAIVRSLHDENMQQWQAVKDAANELTGVTDWVLDPANNQIKYTITEEVYKGTWDIGDGVVYQTGEAAASAKCSQKGQTYRGVDKKRQPPLALCTTETGYKDQWSITFDGTIVIEQELKSLPLDVVAQKIISNASSSNQGTSLLAEAYLENVAQSIFNPDESKQFVKPSDLIGQFEENKVLRI